MRSSRPRGLGAAGREDEARAAVRVSVQRLEADAATPGCWVRPNAWESRLAGADLEAVVVGGLDGILLPKVYGPADVLRFDALLEHFEIRAVSRSAASRSS